MQAVVLTHAPAGLCWRLIRPGECKRVLERGPLIAYQVKLPCCKRLGIYTSGWIESPEWVTSTWRGVWDDAEEDEVERQVHHPAWVSHPGLLCQGCGRRVVVERSVVTSIL